MKLCYALQFLLLGRRSREGAWIEIIVEDCYNLPENSRSREGAWIEILFIQLIYISCICRSREGAWIEISKSA